MSRHAIAAALLYLTAAGSAAAMSLTSSDVADGKAVARAQIYTRCGGENISPALSWTGAPPGTKSFALTMIDLDVPPANWSHWIVVDLPPNAASLARGVKNLPGGARAIVSNFGKAEYDGPCPPRGTGTHRYRFAIWALPMSSISFADDAKATDVNATLEKDSLGKAEITGFVVAPN